MSDIFTLGTYSDVASWSDGTSKDTGDLRRRYNFGDRVSELAIAQDPFFRFVSKIAKKPTDDPEFKFTERRPSYHKRYAYVSGWIENDNTDVVGGTGGDADITMYNDGGTPAAASTGDTVKVYMSTDYESAGNMQNVQGQSTGKIDVGASGTRPAFFLPDQVIRIPLSSTDGGGSSAAAAGGQLLARIKTVTGSLTKDGRECVLLECEVVKAAASGYIYLAGWNGDDVGWGKATDDAAVHDQSISDTLELFRTYVVGSAHGQGTGYPETWKDQPFTTGFGLTQIFKTAIAMDNTTRATVLKYEPNEFARIWREKLIEHKWDIETAILFGSQASVSDVQYTQGAIDFVSSYGNVFSLTHASKTQDDFLDDLSKFLDPRYNNANATVFFCDTATYNWLHKLSGYFANNIASVQPSGFDNTTSSAAFPAGSASASLASGSIALTGKTKAFGVDINVISTPYGDMRVVRNVHLDKSSIKLLGVNMRYCAYRPLVGNGLNRDTSIYVGVQTLENSGVDRRVDLIQTEAGMEWQMPEAHAYWS
jgi:hypothetical protein